MAKKQKYEFNQQSATLRLREPINEGRVMFTIDDERIDSLFNKQFEADVDYIHDGPDVYYITDQNDLQKFVDYVESMGLDADRIQVHEYMNEEGAVTGGGEAYLPAMNMPSKKQNPFKEDALSGYTQDKNFRPGHTKDRGGFQYKDLWGLNEIKQEWSIKNIEGLINDYASKKGLEFTPIDRKQQTNQYGSKKTIYIYKLGDKDLIMIDDKAAGAPRLNDFVVVLGDMQPGTSTLKNSMSVSKNAYTGIEDIFKMLDKAFLNSDQLQTVKEMNQIVDEVFTREDYQKVLQIIDKVKYTNTALYNAIMDLIDDLYPHDYKEVEKLVQMNENYSRFKNETKTRTKPEQFHQAVKSVKRKVEEIHKLYEYMERLKMELSEGSDGLKYRKYTENAIQKIKEAVKQLHKKTKKLK